MADDLSRTHKRTDDTDVELHKMKRRDEEIAVEVEAEDDGPDVELHKKPMHRPHK